MQRHIRKIAWLAAASMVILSLTIGAVLAHEGRPVGDYRFIVGWLDEPAYEGSKNAVSVRVNKIVEGEPEEGAPEEGDHSTPGHHGEGEREATPAMSHEEGDPGEGKEHHGSEDTDSSEAGDHHGDGQNGDSGDHHGGKDLDSTPGMSHGEGGRHDGGLEASNTMSVAVEAMVDTVSGVNVQIIPDGLTFAPENVNGEHVDGEGHAHVYVDGVKISRVYTPWLHLDGLEPGEREIRVTLNANSHGVYTWDGEEVATTTHITVPESYGMAHHSASSAEAEDAMSVSIRVEPDPQGGANLFITDTPGFTFTPQNVGGKHVAGQGHAHVYVNGVKVSRVYGSAHQLGQMAEGKNKVLVTLNTNANSQYTWNGQPVEATVAIEIEAGMGGEGYGDNPPIKTDDGDKEEIHINGTDSDSDSNGMVEKDGQSSVIPMPSASGKPLGSIAGQHEGQAVPVEGLEGSLQVEVTHVASGASKTMDLQAAWNDPGHYVAGLIPTAAGVYEFRFFGTIEGITVDEIFISQGAGGNFDDVQTSAELQFPVQLPELREIESGVRGALQTAQQAQDAALASQGGGSGNALSITALIVGIAGVILGAGGIVLALRARQP